MESTFAPIFTFSSPSSSPPQREEKKKKRKRVSRACLECRKAHAKCDFNRPCSRCARHGLGCCDADPNEMKKRGPSPGNPTKLPRRSSKSGNINAGQFFLC